MNIAVATERPSVLPKADRGQGWRRRESELITRVAALRDAVYAALGFEPVDSTEQWPGSWSAAGVIAELTEKCLGALRQARQRDTETIERVCRLVVELHQVALELSLHEVSVRTRRLADCAAGLTRLRALPNSGDLLDQVCEEAVRRCGFGRAVLSRVDGGSWKPWMAHFSDNAEYNSWFTDWIDQVIPLDDWAPETRLLTERRATVVYDTETAPVYRPIIVDSGRSRSYAVAPIRHGSSVLGFLHVDYHPSRRRVNDVDRDVLWAFAEGLGHIYERTVLMERLRTRRDRVRDVLFSAVDSLNELCELNIDVAHRTDPAASRPAAAPARVPLDKLTPREAEVFALMAAGASNGAIAERLVITGDTVKSHVKHILRKLGAANRAQAIAWSLGERAG